MKPSEKCFFKICYLLTMNRVYTVREVIQMFDGVIPYKRMIYYLRKWTQLGFYDYGVTLDLGWIIPHKIPIRYLGDGLYFK